VPRSERPDGGRAAKAILPPGRQRPPKGKVFLDFLIEHSAWRHGESNTANNSPKDCQIAHAHHPKWHTAFVVSCIRSMILVASHLFAEAMSLVGHEQTTMPCRATAPCSSRAPLAADARPEGAVTRTSDGVTTARRNGGLCILSVNRSLAL